MASSDISIIDDIYSVLKLKHLDFKYDGSKKNLLIEECPLCHSHGYHLYIGITPENLGLWKCFKCDSSSTKNGSNTWTKLRSILVGEEEVVITPAFNYSTGRNKNQYIPAIQKAHTDLLGNEQVLQWLTIQRNISVDSIIKYKLGLRVMQPPNYPEPIAFLSIPHFFRNNLSNVKFRSIPPAEKTFQRIPDADSILFNYDNIDHEKEYIYICEGELDAISLAQVGETNIVSITVGAGSFIPEWYDLLREFRIVYIVLDNDKQGQNGASILADRLGRDRCYNILLPQSGTVDSLGKPIGSIKDLNDYFKYYDIDDFKSLSLKSTKFTIGTIYSMDNLFLKMASRLKETGEILEGIETPWASLNSKMGPIAKGDLVYLTGKPKSGKTSIALNMCYHFANEYEMPALLFCLEMLPERLAAKLICRHRQVESYKMSIEDIYMTRTDFGYKATPLYFGYTADPKLLNVDSMFKIFETAKKKYGIEFLVFDNLQFLSRSLTHTPQEIAMISRQFKLMAMNFDMRIMGIVQPKRFSDEQIMTSSHMKDSSAMEADADTVLIAHRANFVNYNIVTSNRKEDDEGLLGPIITITVDRTRYASGGYTKLFLDGAKSYIREATEQDLNVL